MQNIKNWLNAKNDQGEFLHLRQSLVCIHKTITLPKNLYKAYPREAIANNVSVFLRSIRGDWEKFSFERSMRQSIFHVCKDGSQAVMRVIKLPKGGNHHSARFIKELRDKDAYERYIKALKSVEKDPWLSGHSAELIEIKRDGGYISEYIDGYNLAHLRDVLFNEAVMPTTMREGLIVALKKLVDNLYAYHNENGRLIGDWALHNLVFSDEKQSIFNVDYEGYYTYHEPSLENNITWIEGGLLDLAMYLEMLDSGDEEDKKKISVLRVLDGVRQSGQSYSGSNFLVGYHSMMLKGQMFRGQRECIERLANIPYEFDGKVVVDLGCNSGGMLHSLSEAIDFGYGFDFNPKCVNAAQAVKSLNSVENLDFTTLI